MLAIAAAIAAGCTTLDHTPVPGWPALQIVEHRVPHAQMRERCSRYVGFGMAPEACAEFDFVERTCHLWFSADFPPPRFIVEHERLHCAGYDHVGSTGMERLLQLHSGRRASAATGSSR